MEWTCTTCTVTAEMRKEHSYIVNEKTSMHPLSDINESRRDRMSSLNQIL